MKLSPQNLARASAHRPWRVVGLWVVLFLVGGFLTSKLLSGVLTTQANFTNNPESKQAQTLVEKGLTGPRRSQELVIVQSPTLTVQDPAFRGYVSSLEAKIRDLGPGIVASSTDFYLSHLPTLVSSDRHATLIPVSMAGTLDDAVTNVPKVLAVTLDARHPVGFQVNVAGEATAGKDFKAIAQSDLKKGESIGIVVAIVILLIVFGTLASAVLPVLLAMMAIVVALGIVALIGQAFEFSYFVENMITMMGLAVGIDYSLFIVSRYREERARGREKVDAIALAGATANRAVFFSGMTVVLALLGMLLIPTTIFRSLAAGAIAVVLVAVLASMTLLPAVLSLMGDKVNSLRLPRFGKKRAAQDAEHTTGFFATAARTVMRRPAISLTLGVALLVALALPLFGLRTGFSGVSTLPDSVQSKTAFTILARDFSGGLAQPAQIVVQGDVRSAAVQGAVGRLRGELAADGQFGPSSVQANPAGTLEMVSVPVKGDPSAPDAANAIRRLRSDLIPKAFAGVNARVLVGGQTANSVDFFALTDHYTPIVFAFVLGLSFLLLMVVFRSVVVPLFGVVMNLLSTGAAYGLLVLVNQHGFANGILGFQKVAAIEAWLPLFLFSVLFGLSMDYQVFLLSRIRERYDHTGDNAGSVSFGVRSTGGIITGAALIMVAVFGGFASGSLVALQEMGFGLAAAVLIDATVVRTVLVPSIMKVLGDRNWYLPRWLSWLPKVKVEGREAEAADQEAVRPALEPVR